MKFTAMQHLVIVKITNELGLLQTSYIDWVTFSEQFEQDAYVHIDGKTHGAYSIDHLPLSLPSLR
jgi:hypothetical protein